MKFSGAVLIVVLSLSGAGFRLHAESCETSSIETSSTIAIAAKLRLLAGEMRSQAMVIRELQTAAPDENPTLCATGGLSTSGSVVSCNRTSGQATSGTQSMLNLATRGRECEKKLAALILLLSGREATPLVSASKKESILKNEPEKEPEPEELPERWRNRIKAYFASLADEALTKNSHKTHDVQK